MPATLPKIMDDLHRLGGLEGSDLAEITAVSPATVSAWRSGTVLPSGRVRSLMSRLRDIVDVLAKFYTPEETRTWLFAPHRLLSGQRAIDLIHEGRVAEVRTVLNSLEETLESGVYT